jgi:nitrogen fixation protein NifQ
VNAVALHATAYLLGQPQGPQVPPVLAHYYAVLLTHARRAQDAATLALAGVLAQAYAVHGLHCLPLPGLDAGATRSLLAHCFPGLEQTLQLDWTDGPGVTRSEPRLSEIEDLASLLLDHVDPAAGPAEQACAIALALGTASLGHNHLWQDLLLPSRRELSSLMTHWFPQLVRLNHQDMRWKKFLYRQLCLREQILICRSPTCSACSDYANCFGAETGAAVHRWALASPFEQEVCRV